MGQKDTGRYEDPRFWQRRYHRRRFQKVANLLAGVIGRDSSFLDAGTGTGEYLAFCEPRVRRAVGADVSLSDLKGTRKLCGGNEDAVLADVTSLPFQDSCFDVVLCSEVLEHVPDMQFAISELFRVGGEAIIITMPCISGIRKVLGSIAARVFRLDLRAGEEAVGHINMLPFKQIVESFRSSNWSVKARTWYILSEPLTTHPIPSLFSPCVTLAERLFDWLFPRAGNHVAIVCHRLR